MLFPLLLFTFLPTLVLLGCEEIMKMTVGPRSHASSQPSVTDNGYIYQVIGSSMVLIILWHDVKTHPEPSPLILQIILKTLCCFCKYARCQSESGHWSETAIIQQ